MTNLKLALNAAVLASIEILKIYRDDFDIMIKEDKSPLTKADISSNEIIKNHLKKTNIPILSEEGNNVSFQERKLWDLLWIVDPIDGTKEFIKKNGEFTVNIALVKNSIPIIGVIVAPVLNQIYFAHHELGSFKYENLDFGKYDVNQIIKSSIRLTIKKNSNDYKVVASRSHLSIETENFINRIKLSEKNVKIVSIGSSLKLCLVAEGKADCYPRHAPTMEWDTAAGHAVCKYAGFSVTDLTTNEPLKYNKENLLNNWFLVN